MNPFVFHCPTKVAFGELIADTAADVVKDFGGQKTFIVTDEILMKTGILRPILGSFADNSYCIFTDVPPDSDVETVNRATQIAREFGCDAVLAVGGGSVLDTAKVVNICLSFGGELMEYQGLNNLTERLKPLIAIPTTAGTGSEVSMMAMIKDNKEGKKLLFASRFLAPDAAILDPTLIVSLPPRLTAATGLDAVTHDIEAFSTGISNSSFTDALCLESLKLLFAHLPRATSHGDDLEARGATLIGSAMAGVAFTNSGVGIVHALAHALGAKYGIHHGTANSIFLPHGMRFNLDVISSRYAEISRFLARSNSKNDHEASIALIDALEELSHKIGLPMRMRDAGVPVLKDTQLEELASLASCDPAIMFNPKESSVEDIIGIYERGLLMQCFATTHELNQIMLELWSSIGADHGMSSRLLQSKMIARFNYSDPAACITVDCSDGQALKVYAGDCQVKPLVEMSMKSDIAHEFWLGKVSIPVAILTGKIASKGPVNQALALLPVIKPAFEFYPNIYQKYTARDAVALS